ncbi:hypothetical protein D3C75_973110 [compost metagenome]
MRRNAAKFTAKCSPADVFHAEIGKAIALRKALGLTVPSEYTDAPQPEIAKAGAKVRLSGGAEGTVYTVTQHIERGYDRLCENYVNVVIPQARRTMTILDDTDVDYSASQTKGVAA